MNRFKIIALNHKSFDISEIGKFHIEEKDWSDRFSPARALPGIEEIMFLSTCNRVEFLVHHTGITNEAFLSDFFLAVYPKLSPEELKKVLSSISVFEKEEAINHLFKVTSSLDSLVVGEREIITQVRNAYEACRKQHLTGDIIRMAVQKAIECAKKVYTHTNIARHPVSVVSLAYRRLKDLNVKLDARVVVIGAGVTNTVLAKYLRKHGFSKFTVFNRTLANGEKLAAELGGRALPLSELKNFNEGFDILLTCTSSSEPIVTQELYSSLLAKDPARKIVIDLAVPGDVDEKVQNSFDIHYIAVGSLKEIARKNLAEREKELAACEQIIFNHLSGFKSEFKERQVELAMINVPKKVKEIRDAAVNEVFAKEIEKLDEHSKETLDKIISYFEKKYISVPMKMAKEILLEEVSSK